MGRGLMLDDVLWSRVQQLSPKDRELIELLAVSGLPLRLRDAYASARDPRVDPQMIARMRAEHLVRSTGPRLTDEVDLFHDRIRESVMGRLHTAVQRSYHGVLATTLETAGDVDSETVGAHFEGAGNADRAGVHYATAADVAARALAFERAARLYRKSIDLRPALGVTAAPLRIELGHALANAGRGADAAVQYKRAGDALPARRTELLRMAATQLCITGHIDEGREIFRGTMRTLGLRMPSTAVGNVTSLLARRLVCASADFARPRIHRATLIAISRASTRCGPSAPRSRPSTSSVSRRCNRRRCCSHCGPPSRVALRCVSRGKRCSSERVGGARGRAAELLANARSLAAHIGDTHAEGWSSRDGVDSVPPI
jgi:hypothetical protein